MGDGCLSPWANASAPESRPISHHCIPSPLPIAVATGSVAGSPLPGRQHGGSVQVQDRVAIAARTRLTPWEDSPYVKQLDQQLEAARW